ncbi:MAG TPA: hypothetical protein VFS05_15990, partial [Gemmatimonadaceae bacterium]|nr:hypothetical protein [Gemmatimonadaceae bacterium]
RAAAARTTLARLRLPYLSGAAVSAARLGDRPALAHLTGVVEGEAAGSELVYETAQALINLAEAWSIAGDAAAAADRLARGEAAARAHGFHELVHQAEQVRAATGALAARRLEARRGPSLSPASRRVLASLETLESTTVVGD